MPITNNKNCIYNQINNNFQINNSLTKNYFNKKIPVYIIPKSNQLENHYNNTQSSILYNNDNQQNNEAINLYKFVQKENNVNMDYTNQNKINDYTKNLISSNNNNKNSPFSISSNLNKPIKQFLQKESYDKINKNHFLKKKFLE